ncbi:GNAT family N-acetyltransferase [Enterococcus dispar]|uniref:N-acetyltransferase domain-containing protein n=1 Tax=Enterococcus dispar ATCC 51266 TaxID=1139219 RepID=S1NBF0_9ENTE|nr:GNAT family N-acetyltransferase [Enterococcus dispar]EOT39225.1 hypothetical protein OMK_02221 [Enterococcus dispar ATCC 51266]EOW86360.1 hypothetical protein I569_01683 [Enterococcus dispar ATCC 51266]OJG38268.1 hypothetical protein RV01_GL000404 [Enterococcus dispar]
MGVKTHLATTKEKEAVVAFFDKVMAQIDYPVVSWVPAIYPLVTDLTKALANEELYLATIADEIVGSVIFNHTHEAEYSEIAWENRTLSDTAFLVIHTLLADCDYKGQGVGKSLLACAKEVALAKQCQAIRLDVFADNLPAKSLYEKCGYQWRERKELRSFDDRGTDTCDLYELTL